MKKLCKGDIVEFGRYNNGKGKKTLTWKVLAKKGNKALLITEYGIDCKRYHDKEECIAWEACTLRKWLNSKFYNTAFSDEEKKMIFVTDVTADRNPDTGTYPGQDTQDKVFLLSIQEAEHYFESDEDRECVATEYAVTKGAYTDEDDGNCWWWLRSLGEDADYASGIYSDGDIDIGGALICSEDCAVRPALWIGVESLNHFGIGGEDSSAKSDGSIKENCLHQSAEKIPDSNYKVGNIVEFGRYDDGNGINPVKWKILAKEGNKALLITEYGIDCRKYNEQRADITWETCTLRKWLNSDFYDAAFNDDEKRKITVTDVTADSNPHFEINPGKDTRDKVFLLSIPEVRKYFDTEGKRTCKPTEYSVSNGVHLDNNGKCWWALRTHGKGTDYVTVIDTLGHMDFSGYCVNLVGNAVRPALWINIEP